MFCTNCGKQITEKSSFCQFCGKSVTKTDPKIETLKVNETAITSAVTNIKPLISVQDLFTKTWEVFRKVWLTALIVALIGVLIQTIVKKIIFGIWGISFGISSLITLGMQSRFFVSNLLFNLAGLIIIWTAFLLINFWMQTAIVYVIKNQEERDKTQAVKTALKQSWQAMGPISVISLLTSLFTGIGFILLIIPGIFLTFMWQYATFSYIFDGKKGIDALKHSWNLIWPKFWEVLGRNAIVILITLVIGLFINKGILGIAKNLIITPFWIAFSYILYLDLKDKATK